MIQRMQRLVLPLVGVVALLGGMLAQLAGSANPVYALDTPTVVVTSDDASSVFSQAVTLTTTVTGTGVTPTGTVDFVDGATPLCTAEPLTSDTTNVATASCTTSELSVGTHSITGEYSGDAVYDPTTSAAFVQDVTKAGTTGVLVSDDLTAALGQSVTFTATISPAAPATATPSLGTVSFVADTFAIGGCEARPLTGGVATCTAIADIAGPASITAVFNGDANFTTSTSPAISQDTAKGTSTTALVSNHNPARSGQAVTFSATVTSTAGTPTGTVSFFRVRPDTTREALGTVTLAAGLATLTTSSLPIQSGMDIVAEYSGSLNHDPSTLTIDQTVQRSLSKTLITSSRKNSKAGQPVTYKVTVNADGGGEGIPTGLVAIYRTRANGSLQWIGRGNLRNGTTNIVVSGLPVGSYKIQAQYRGTTTFRPSVRTMTQTVTS